MTRPRRQRGPDSAVTGFRWKLLTAVGIVVSAVTALGLYLAGRNAAADMQKEFQLQFQSALDSLHHVQELRYLEIAGRCDALVHNPRIHASLEDDAQDLLYFNARDQLDDLLYNQDRQPDAPATNALRATFYRFLDARGAMIPPPAFRQAGELTTLEERQLAVSALPSRQEVGYLARTAGEKRGTINEVIAVPIASSETGEVISALMVGFEPVNLDAARSGTPIRSGVWLGGLLYLPALGDETLAELGAQVRRNTSAKERAAQSFKARVEGTPSLVFYKLLNPGSVLAPANEVCVYPLASSLAAQRRLRWHIGGIGALVLLGGLLASHLVTRRFATPVERLAFDSVENRSQRIRAEVALESTHRELERSARFSADASHQLKTPVTVLRVGLEELLARESLSTEMHDDLSALVRQTYRLGGVIQDLLLLSRLDAGRLRLEVGVVDLRHLIEGWLDDLSVLPDPLDLRVETDLPAELCIAGEKRYTTLIVQNLLENARKYNRAEGGIRVVARDDGARKAILIVGNNGPPIGLAEREHIFERFHRGAVGENVPGHGLGLNLARELARLHGGDLRLVRSENDWTEFEVSFRLASCAELVTDPREPHL